MTNLTPAQIFNIYRTGEIYKTTAFKNLSLYLENGEDDSQRLASKHGMIILGLGVAEERTLRLFNY